VTGQGLSRPDSSRFGEVALRVGGQEVFDVDLVHCADALGKRRLAAYRRNLTRWIGAGHRGSAPVWQGCDGGPVYVAPWHKLPTPQTTLLAATEQPHEGGALLIGSRALQRAVAELAGARVPMEPIVEIRASRKGRPWSPRWAAIAPTTCG
jgi:hypothetical protein